MSVPMNEPGRVLVVDDDHTVADLYSLHLSDRFEVTTAYGGREALDVISADIDVVLLDRRMPDLSGDEVLEEIRSRGLGCRVIMVTAIDPDFDIVDMSFDDYLRKPVKRDDLIAAIEQQFAVTEYDDRVDEYFATISKLQVLEDAKPGFKLEENEDYQALAVRAEELQSEAEGLLDGLDAVTAFRAIGRGNE